MKATILAIAILAGVLFVGNHSSTTIADTPRLPIEYLLLDRPIGGYWKFRDGNVLCYVYKEGYGGGISCFESPIQTKPTTK